MGRILRFIGIGLLLFVDVSAMSGCRTANIPVSPPDERSLSAPSYEVIDATSPFWTFWGRSGSADVSQRRRLFRDIVIAAHPELFEANVIGVDPTNKSSDLDKRLAIYLTELPTRIQAMERISQAIRSDLTTYDRTFRVAFPDMRWSGKVYFTISVDAFDGAVRGVSGKPALLFGIDKIAKIHGENANLSALFHHELFHTYHFDVNPLPEPKPDGPHGLLMPLWSEGLAVYVSKELNPSATWSQVLLSDEMVRNATQALPALAAELRTKLDDATEENYRDFFLGAGRRADVPNRSGYFIGYLVAKTLGKNRSLQQLARLGGPELRAEVDAALLEMSRSPTH